MAAIFEYMIVYQKPGGQRVGLYKGMDQDELEKVIRGIQADGCTVEKMEIIRRTNG